MKTTETKKWSAREKELFAAVQQYAEAHTNKQYSIPDCRIIHNITDSEYKWLLETCDYLINQIEQKAKLNLRVRLLDPEIKHAEVAAIKAYLELEEGKTTGGSTNINIQFAKTAEELATIIKHGDDDE